MNQETWTMSHKEIERLALFEKVASRRITQAQATTQMGVCERHFRRLLRGYRQRGAQALISKHRAVAPNNRLPASVRRRALELIREHYPDFGPTFAHTPQAKGCIERLFKTVDRLVKELRLRGISTMAQANSFLEGYREVFNEQFAKAPDDADDAHREHLQDERRMPCSNQLRYIAAGR